jgi:hypothetical protein
MRSALAAACLAFLGLVVMCSGACLTGCPLRVDPTSEDACPHRPNCGQCASEAVCAWCSTGAGMRDGTCLPASIAGPHCTGTLVTVPDLCPTP